MGAWLGVLTRLSVAAKDRPAGPGAVSNEARLGITNRMGDNEFMPQLDPTPDPAPGGPDAVDHDSDDLPPVTPDGPVATEVADKIPDALEEPEEGKQEGEDSHPDEAAKSKDDPV